MQLPFKFTGAHLLAVTWLAIVMSQAACSEQQAPLRPSGTRPSTYTAAAATSSVKPSTQEKKDTIASPNCAPLALLDDDDDEGDDDEGGGGGDDNNGNNTQVIVQPAIPVVPSVVVSSPPVVDGTVVVDNNGNGGGGGGGANGSTVEVPSSPVLVPCKVVTGSAQTGAKSPTPTVDSSTPAGTVASGSQTSVPGTPSPSTPGSAGSSTPVVANIPTPTPVTPPVALLDGAQLYNSDCASCHRSLASSDVSNSSLGSIKSAISNVGAMRSIKLSDAVLQAIANVL